MVISWEPYFLAIVRCFNIWAEYLSPSLSRLFLPTVVFSQLDLTVHTHTHTQIARVWTVSHTERLFKLVSVWWIIQSCPSPLPLCICVLVGCACVKDEHLRSEWHCRRSLLSYRIGGTSVSECNTSKERAGKMCIQTEWQRDAQMHTNTGKAIYISDNEWWIP